MRILGSLSSHDSCAVHCVQVTFVTATVLRVDKETFGVAFSVGVKEGLLKIQNKTEESEFQMAGRISAQAVGNGEIEEMVKV